MITDEIEESIKKTKQIIIKRMRFKLVAKNKLEDTFIFWQREREREIGGRRRKKIHQSPNVTPPFTHTRPSRRPRYMLPTLPWKTMFDHKMKREKCGASHFCF